MDQDCDNSSLAVFTPSNIIFVGISIICSSVLWYIIGSTGLSSHFSVDRPGVPGVLCYFAGPPPVYFWYRSMIPWIGIFLHAFWQLHRHCLKLFLFYKSKFEHSSWALDKCGLVILVHTSLEKGHLNVNCLDSKFVKKEIEAQPTWFSQCCLSPLVVRMTLLNWLMVSVDIPLSIS